MKRRKIRNLLLGFSFGLFDPAQFAVFTVDDPTTVVSGAGGDTLAGGGGSGGGGNPPAKTYTAAEFTGVKNARDAIKKKFKALASALGFDPDNITFEETGDPEHPFEITGDGVDEVMAAIEKAKQSNGDPSRTRKDAEDRKRRIQAPIIKERDVEKAKVAALTNWIRKNGVVAPIRLACKTLNAIDDDGGKYEDIVGLLSPRMPINIEWDEEEKTVSVSIGCNGENGEPMEGTTGDPMKDAEKLVADLLGKRPKYKSANIRPGPGVGNRPANGSPVSRSSHVADAVEAFTGIRPSSAPKN